MKTILLVLTLLSVTAQSSENSVRVKVLLEELIMSLNEESIAPLVDLMVNDESLDLVKDLLSEHGNVVSANCFISHTSEVFFGYLCHVTYKKHRSGNNMVFYVFKDEEKYIGTRLGVSEMHGDKDHCLKNITVEEGLSGQMTFELEKCND
ncbi:hypothetical protein OAP14_02620 [Aliiglaciecola sp.]|nr:hypothetical protein [Aliiglaciecola sp.]